MTPLPPPVREPVRSRPVGRTCALVALLIVLAVGSHAPAVGAAEEPEPEPTGVTVLDDADEAQPDAAVVIDDETSDTVRRIRRELVFVGVVSSAALLVYLWHTSPRRRLRVASRRLHATED